MCVVLQYSRAQFALNSFPFNHSIFICTNTKQPSISLLLFLFPRAPLFCLELCVNANRKLVFLCKAEVHRTTMLYYASVWYIR